MQNKQLNLLQCIITQNLHTLSAAMITQKPVLSERARATEYESEFEQLQQQQQQQNALTPAALQTNSLRAQERNNNVHALSLSPTLSCCTTNTLSLFNTAQTCRRRAHST